MAAGKFLDCSAIDSGRRGVYSLLRHREANSQDSQPKSPKEGVRRERKQSLKETKDNFHSSIFIHRAMGDSSSWAAFQTFRFEGSRLGRGSSPRKWFFRISLSAHSFRERGGSEPPVTPGPASSALEPPRAQARRLIVGILVGAGLLIAALVYLYGAFQAADLVNIDPEKGNQMAYLLYGYRLWESGYTFKGDRNRMPALPVILAITYQKGWHLEDDFFPRARTLCVLLSLFCLGVVGAAACVTLGRTPGLVLTLVLAFTLYIYRAAYVQAEVLYYTSSGLVFIGALALLRRPVWWGRLLWAWSWASRI
jgi:hypothetical protein